MASGVINRFDSAINSVRDFVMPDIGNGVLIEPVTSGLPLANKGDEKMSRDKKLGFHYSFTPRELFYFLFKKKVCPKCQQLMEKHKNYTIKASGGSSPSYNFDSVMQMSTGPVKAYKHFFVCNNCNSQYTLAELAYRKG